MEPWPRVAVVGAGAVGCYFGGRLGQAGAPVTLIGRPGRASPHLDAVGRDGLWIRSFAGDVRVPLAVGGCSEVLPSADLVLFCVKTVDTDEAARRIAPRLRHDSVVVSLQNGVDNVERMGRAGVRALSAVVFVAAEVERPGEVTHRGRGDLVIGDAECTAQVERVSRWFERSGVPCRVSPDVERELWIKLCVNSMANATSALTGATYGRIAGHEPAWQIATEVAREAVAVARAAGIGLDEEEVLRRGGEICRSVGQATSSTRQDVARGRPTEIDALNGYLARRAAELGIAAPVNRTLWALVKLREQRQAD